MDKERISRETAAAAADARAKINKAIAEMFRELLAAEPSLALLFSRNNAQELRGIPDEQLAVVFRLARLGHSLVCAEVMTGAYRTNEPAPHPAPAGLH